MRKLLLLFSAMTVMLVSCEKMGGNKTKTVTVELSSELSFMDFDNIKVFEYTEAGDKVGSNTIDSPKAGQSYTVTITSERAEKVKVYLDYSTMFDSRNIKWVQQVFFLDNANTTINLNGETMIGNKEP